VGKNEGGEDASCVGLETTLPFSSHGQAGRGAALPQRRCSIPYGVASPVATRVRGRRRRTSNDVKSRFCPLRGSRTTGGTTAAPWPSHLHGNATYPKSPTTGTRAKQAHTSVELVGSEVSHNALQETNGADHVNRRLSLIGRPGSQDLKNKRSPSGHVIKMDGQD
jgi:hypothetical protein